MGRYGFLVSLELQTGIESFQGVSCEGWFQKILRLGAHLFPDVNQSLAHLTSRCEVSRMAGRVLGAGGRPPRSRSGRLQTKRAALGSLPSREWDDDGKISNGKI